MEGEAVEFRQLHVSTRHAGPRCGTRARYSAAVNTRNLQELVLEKEREKFSFGNSTFNNVIVEQRNLVTARTNELGALGAYARARVGLDQIVGETLEKNNVSLDDGIKGRVARESIVTTSPTVAK